MDDLRSVAIRGLKRMYRPERGLFAFRLRRVACPSRRRRHDLPSHNGSHGGAALGHATQPRGGDLLEGVSRRYTAIALIGLGAEDGKVASDVLGGQDARDVCRRLLDDVEQLRNLGDVALTLWAAVTFHDAEAVRARDRLRELQPWEGEHPTVEVAWSLMALVADLRYGTGLKPLPHDDGLARRISRRLISSFVPASGMFPHWPSGSVLPPRRTSARRSFLRSHVACFADLVYPIQALAHFHAWTGDEEAIAAARQCAERLCALQGPEGQWWWHYDVRTGRVVERYPVYAVHQDAMAPMALMALQNACGVDHTEAIERGLRWLIRPPKPGHALVDRGSDVIWRKVGRHEPRKLSRSVQALASRVHPALRVPGLDAVLRPGSVDYECRPYHLGWLLYAWSRRRFAA